MPTPDDVGRVDTRLGEERGNGLLERPDVVLGILERPVGLEPDVVVGLRQMLVDRRRSGSRRPPSRARVRRRSRRAPRGPTPCRSRCRSRSRAASLCVHRSRRRWGSTIDLEARVGRTSASNASCPVGERVSLADERRPARRGPLSASRIARGRSAGCIRRQSSDRQALAPRRGGGEARAVAVAGCRRATTRPPGRTASIASASAASSPAASNATSTPSRRRPGSRPSRLARPRPGAAGGRSATIAAAADHPKQLHEQEPDRAAAEDAGGRARPDVAEVERVERDSERLEQRASASDSESGSGCSEPLRPRHSVRRRAVGRAVPGEPAARGRGAAARAGRLRSVRT